LRGIAARSTLVAMTLASRLPLLAIVCAAISACAPINNHTASKHPPIAGGYKDATPDTGEFAIAAAFAAREESRRSGTPIRIVKITRRETQVVAGTNLRIRVTALRNGATPETADIVVFRDLFGHQQLTSWRWLGR
jgi:hypothetical protein